MVLETYHRSYVLLKPRSPTAETPFQVQEKGSQVNNI